MKINSFVNLRCRPAVGAMFSAAAMTGLILGDLSSQASAAGLKRNDYESCTNALMNDGISAANAADACASALEPTDISSCVGKIVGQSGIAAPDALNSCIRVRRPEEMASCVVQINRGVEAAPADEVLSYCTRSLLPDDYSDCVVGIDAATDFGPVDIMQTCIAADYSIPDDFYPNFIPAGELTRPTE